MCLAQERRRGANRPISGQEEESDVERRSVPGIVSHSIPWTRPSRKPGGGKKPRALHPGLPFYILPLERGVNLSAACCIYRVSTGLDECLQSGRRLSPA